jgi:hypothetical protein
MDVGGYFQPKPPSALFFDTLILPLNLCKAVQICNQLYKFSEKINHLSSKISNNFIKIETLKKIH